MKVKDIMTVSAGACSPEDKVTDAAVIMWQKDCGIVPVVGGDGKVLGVVTDRDLCIALASRDLTAAETVLGDIIGGEVHTCAPNDDLKKAAKTMAKKQIHRLPVVDGEGRLAGMLSVADLVRAAGGKKKDKSLSAKRIFKLIAAINRKPPIVLMAAEAPEVAEAAEEGPGEVSAASSARDSGETN